MARTKKVSNKALNEEINEFVKGRKSNIGFGAKFILWFSFLYLMFQVSRIWIDYPFLPF